MREFTRPDRPPHFRYRERVAWRPVALWRVKADSRYVEKTGKKIWLRRVVELETMFSEWTAYETDQ